MEVKKLFKKEFKQALKQIKKFDHIVVFRHQRPDYDAFGTQLGLVTWLKDSFPYKTIHYVGSNHSTFTGRIYPPMEEVDDKFFDEDFLGIVVDTGNSQRIDDERYQKAKFLIKFDHHPNIEPYGNINIVANELSSCSELVASFCLTFKKKYPLSLLSSKYFYTGIVGDTGRFLFPSTDKDTLRLSAELLETGLVPSFGVLPKYLFYFCKSFDFTSLDSSTTLPSLTKTNIQQILFPLPSLAEQQRILNKIESLFTKLDEIALNLV